jgi:hypothetical protein
MNMVTSLKQPQTLSQMCQNEVFGMFLKKFLFFTGRIFVRRLISAFQGNSTSMADSSVHFEELSTVVSEIVKTLRSHNNCNCGSLAEELTGDMLPRLCLDLAMAGVPSPLAKHCLEDCRNLEMSDSALKTKLDIALKMIECE